MSWHQPVDDSRDGGIVKLLIYAVSVVGVCIYLGVAVLTNNAFAALIFGFGIWIAMLTITGIMIDFGEDIMKELRRINAR